MDSFLGIIDWKSRRILAGSVVYCRQKTPKYIHLHLIRVNTVKQSSQPAHQLPGVIRIMEADLDQGPLKVLEEMIQIFCRSRWLIPAFLR